MSLITAGSISLDSTFKEYVSKVRVEKIFSRKKNLFISPDKRVSICAGFLALTVAVAVAAVAQPPGNKYLLF